MRVHPGSCSRSSLTKHGIAVDILEAEDHLDQQPRAAIYGTPAIPEFHRAGILDEMRRRGMVDEQDVLAAVRRPQLHHGLR